VSPTSISTSAREDYMLMVCRCNRVVLWKCRCIRLGMHINKLRIYRSTTSTVKVAVFGKRNEVEFEVLDFIYLLVWYLARRCQTYG
jgi:hypothetical protein